MAVGDCERAFQRTAAADGIVLVRAREAWCNQRGHLGLPEQVGDVAQVLEAIFLALGGDLAVQSRKAMTPLPGDLLHQPTRTLIEIDEPQHFTSHRLLTFDFYLDEHPAGFDTEHYRALCRDWQATADRYFRAKSAVAFGVGGRQRQRAYHDALRDLAAPAMSRRPVIRVPVADRDGIAAYRGIRNRLTELLV